MNKVMMMGRLTRDPETRYGSGSSGTTFSRFSLAVNRRFKRDGEPEADFFDCTAFGKTAEFVDKYLKKGTKVVAIGRLENNNYTNKNGEKVYTVRIMVEEVEFAESKAAGSSGGYTGGGSNADDMPMGAESGFMNIPDGVEEDLPF